eukprot:PhM_4_TR5721/c0_g1_i2/m.90470/K10575/UBE2G1, UBC7; ubiquitin-conjugating enzyme E2 G1
MSTATNTAKKSSSAPATTNRATLMLMQQLKELQKNPIEGFSAGLRDDTNPYMWDVMLIGQESTAYEGGYFRATLEFPKDYPNMPPTMTFLSTMWHPNIYPDGKVCISILHPPGEDSYGYESAAERWSPVQTISSILLSVVSMLHSPNDESPANVEAAVQWRKDNAGYLRKVRQLARKSVEDC